MTKKIKKLPAKITTKSITTDGSLDVIKINELLTSAIPTVRDDVCRVLGEGLSAVKPVVCEGEVFSEVDYPTRLKYAEVIADILGERKEIAPKGDLHIHFTNVLQKIRSYERGRTPDDVPPLQADVFPSPSDAIQINRTSNGSDSKRKS